MQSFETQATHQRTKAIDEPKRALCRSPIRVINFMPPEIIMFGETGIVTTLEANPPDYVLVQTRPTIEYGFRSSVEDRHLGWRVWRRKDR